jgi:hypothetical protein
LDLYLFNTKSHVPLFAQHQIGLWSLVNGCQSDAK